MYTHDARKVDLAPVLYEMSICRFSDT